MSTRYQFVPWTRRGAASGIVRTDPLAASIPARVALPVNLRVNDRVEVDVELALYGPGDVTGLDTLQIVRSDPAPWASDFEPNYFPSVEFDRADFPWLFTPAAADTRGRLRPWLSLIVVRRQEGVNIDFQPGQPLPVLRCHFARSPPESSCQHMLRSQSASRRPSRSMPALSLGHFEYTAVARDRHSPHGQRHGFGPRHSSHSPPKGLGWDGLPLRGRQRLAD